MGRGARRCPPLLPLSLPLLMPSEVTLSLLDPLLERPRQAFYPAIWGTGIVRVHPSIHGSAPDGMNAHSDEGVKLLTLTLVAHVSVGKTVYRGPSVVIGRVGWIVRNFGQQSQ